MQTAKRIMHISWLKHGVRWTLLSWSTTTTADIKNQRICFMLSNRANKNANESRQRWSPVRMQHGHEIISLITSTQNATHRAERTSGGWRRRIRNELRIRFAVRCRFSSIVKLLLACNCNKTGKNVRILNSKWTKGTNELISRQKWARTRAHAISNERYMGLNCVYVIKKERRRSLKVINVAMKSHGLIRASQHQQSAEYHFCACTHADVVILLSTLLFCFAVRCMTHKFCVWFGPLECAHLQAIKWKPTQLRRFLLYWTARAFAVCSFTKFTPHGTCLHSSIRLLVMHVHGLFCLRILFLVVLKKKIMFTIERIFFCIGLFLLSVWPMNLRFAMGWLFETSRFAFDHTRKENKSNKN